MHIAPIFTERVWYFLFLNCLLWKNLLINFLGGLNMIKRMDGINSMSTMADWVQIISWVSSPIGSAVLLFTNESTE